MENFVQMLSPIAPHLAEELWLRLGYQQSITYVPWPSFDEKWTKENQVEIVIQVNGKIVERLAIDVNLSQEAMQQAAEALPKVQEAIAGKTIRKVIAVKGKLVNIVAN